MSFGWLSGLWGRRGAPGGRRRMAPQALRELSDEIKADALRKARVSAHEIVLDPERGEPETTLVVWVNTDTRPEVGAWLEGAEIYVAPPEVRTDWIFLPRTPEAVMIGRVEAGATWPAFRFNLRFPADRYRRHLETVASSGVISLTSELPEPGPDRRPPSRCVFVAVEAQRLRDFLRDLPPEPVV